ncbi:MAG: aryl-sulfate sulfotransferase, partial [Bacteroidales bacterium]|nr:aryl-sulfate sulfotransferase [Bacteroidales bacterium]
VTGIHQDIKAQSLVLPEGFPEMDINVSEGTSEGYFFLGPMPIGSNTPGCLIIMDDYGTPVFYRKTKNKTYCFQPYPTGNLAYFEGKILKYLEIDSAYQSIDTMGCFDCDRFDIHELRILEDGGYILAGFKYRTVDMSTIVPGGNAAATIQDYVIQEFDADDQIIFEWNTKDYYEITDVNDNVDLTASVIDPTSFCSIEVESDTSLIMSMAHQDEITKVDRRTGEVIWRMGGKNNQFTFVNSTRPFTRQHDARRLPNGNIIVFDDGTFSTPFYSRAVEYKIDEDSMIATQVWEFDHGKTIQSTHKGSVQRLLNGNTLIGWGGFGSNPAVPSATEVKPDGTIVFEVGTPQHDGSYRVRKFPWRTNLFEAVVDSVDFGNWNGYTEAVYQLMIKNNSADSLKITSAALRTSYFYVDELFPIVIPANEQEILSVIFYPSGAAQNSKLYDVLTINSDSQDTIQRIAIQVHLQGYVPDLISPVANLIPADDTLSREGIVTIQFSEPVRNLDDSEITDENVTALIIYAEENIDGESLPFEASVNQEKTEITVTPSTPLKSGQHYFIQVGSVEDESGNPSLTSSKIYTAENFVFSGLTEEPDFWRIYPNPVNDLLHITGRQEFRYHVDLLNITGEILHSKEMMQGRIDIDMTGMLPGAYYIKITGGEMNYAINRIVVKY